MKLNILIPLAGNRTFKKEEGSAFPKILNEVNGKLLLETAASPMLELPYQKNFLTVVPKSHVKQYNLDRVLASLSDDISVIQIEGDTQGATCTSLLAVEKLWLDEPLIITSFEQIIDLHLEPLIKRFVNEDVECGVLTFDSIHPRFSYVMCDEIGTVLQAAEKRPISRHAVAGLYYFSKASDFVDAAKSTILNNATDSGYYLSNTINEYVLNGKKVKAYPIDSKRYFHFYDSHNLEQYESTLGGHFLNESVLIQSKKYVESFSNKDIDAVSEFFSDGFELTDPSVQLKGKAPVLEYIEGIFKGCSTLDFSETNIFVDGKSSVIEFELVIDGLSLIGTDVIQWDNGNKMISMSAYLYERKSENS